MRTTTERGYGHTHQHSRRLAFASLPEWSACVRCGDMMWKWARDTHGRSALHWDHNNQRDGYLGFACQHCNTRAGQRTSRHHTIGHHGDPGPGW
jgi:hypothetical protein